MLYVKGKSECRENAIQYSWCKNQHMFEGSHFITGVKRGEFLVFSSKARKLLQKVETTELLFVRNPLKIHNCPRTGQGKHFCELKMAVF